MELYQEIIIKAFENLKKMPCYPQIDYTKIVQLTCYQALNKIQAIIQDDSFSDTECFEKIERIVCLFEEIGSDGGNRHDW